MQFHCNTGVQMNLRNKNFSHFFSRKLSCCYVWFLTYDMLQKYVDKRSRREKSGSLRRRTQGWGLAHTSGPSPPGMSYKTTKTQSAGVKAAQESRMSPSPWWCCCRWGESGPVWWFFSLLVWLHWDRNTCWVTQTQSSEGKKETCTYNSVTSSRTISEAMSQECEENRVNGTRKVTFPTPTPLSNQLDAEGYWRSHQIPAGCRRSPCQFSWQCEFWNQYICPPALQGENPQMRDSTTFWLTSAYFHTFHHLQSTPNL